MDDGLIDTAVRIIKVHLGGFSLGFTLSAILFAAAFKRSFSAKSAALSREDGLGKQIDRRKESPDKSFAN
jgi:hypothetical protein